MQYKVLYLLCPGNPRAQNHVSLVRVAVKTPKPPELLCARCHHPESEHGKSGFRPCLAMVGDDLVTREFCTCNKFQAAVIRKAA
jgi:hypothetical protein